MSHAGSRLRPPPRLLDADTRTSRAVQAAVLALLLVGAAVANPVRPLPFDVCVFKRLTGHACLTCGMTRALCWAVRGEWTQSVACHPAGPIVAVALAAWAIVSTVDAWCGQVIADTLRRRAGAALMAAGGVVLLTTWFARLAIGG
jgi:hypothetical protein